MIANASIYRLSVRTETVNSNEWRFYLNLTNFTPEDQGHYMCIVSNAADKVMEVFDVEMVGVVAAGPTGGWKNGLSKS